MFLVTYILIFVAIVIVFSLIKIINQYEKGLVFTLGKFTGIRNPGLNFVFPVIQRMVVVDMRVRTVDIQKQQVMTKDNVPVDVNGVVFFKVNKVDDAIIKVQDYEYAIAQYAQTALRDVIGGMTLDTVLVERQQIGDEIRKIVDKETEQWGLDVQVIKLQDIEVPDDLKRKIFGCILLAGTIIAFSLGFVSGYKKEQSPFPWMYLLAGLIYNTAFGYDAFQESKGAKPAKQIKSSKR